MSLITGRPDYSYFEQMGSKFPLSPNFARITPKLLNAFASNFLTDDFLNFKKRKVL